MTDNFSTVALHGDCGSTTKEDALKKLGVTMDWYEKCLLCKHCYTKIDDAETIYCRLKYCRFEGRRTAKQTGEE